MRLLSGLFATALVLGSCAAERPTTLASPDDSARSDECHEAARDLPESRNFTPPTHSEGERTVMPIVFSDGTTAELTYPQELDLDSLGISVLRTSAVIEGDGPDSGRGIDIRYGVPSGSMTKGHDPIACYEGAHGQVEVWETGDEVVPHWMFVPLHSWTAYIWDGNVGNFLTEDQRETWVTALTADLHPDGWITLRASRQLRIGAEHTGDVQIELGDLRERAILLWPIQCRRNSKNAQSMDVETREVGGGQAFASWCDENGPIEVHVYADAPFIRNVAKHLEIRNVHHAYAPEKYHIVP